MNIMKLVFRYTTLFVFLNIASAFFNINRFNPSIIHKIGKYTNRNCLMQLKCNSNNYNSTEKFNNTNIKTHQHSQLSQSIKNHSIVPLLKPKPILEISFDFMFLNWKSVNRIYLSANNDRIIILFGNDNKGVYYIHPKQLPKIEYLISLTTANVTIEQSSNFDNPWYHLYCNPRLPNTSQNIQDANTDANANTDPYDDDDDGFNDNYGFDFGLGM